MIVPRTACTATSTAVITPFSRRTSQDAPGYLVAPEIGQRRRQATLCRNVDELDIVEPQNRINVEQFVVTDERRSWSIEFVRDIGPPLFVQPMVGGATVR